LVVHSQSALDTVDSWRYNTTMSIGRIYCPDCDEIWFDDEPCCPSCGLDREELVAAESFLEDYDVC